MQMNLPGSLMGACSRTAPAGWVTAANLPLLDASSMAVSMSWLAAPPSRNPRVLCGNRASAMASARTTPREARWAAAEAARSMTRSPPTKQPSRGACPFCEYRTIFIRGLLWCPCGVWRSDGDDSTGAGCSHPRGWLHPVWYSCHASICCGRGWGSRMSFVSLTRFATIVPGGHIHDDFPPLAVCDRGIHHDPRGAVRELDRWSAGSHPAAARLDPQRAAVRLRGAH